MGANPFDAGILEHPCDAALGILLPPCTSENVLLLRLTREKENIQSRPLLNITCFTPGAEGRGEKVALTNIASKPGIQLPAHSRQFDLVVLCGEATLGSNARESASLLVEIRRILAPEGELFIHVGRPPRTLVANEDRGAEHRVTPISKYRAGLLAVLHWSKRLCLARALANAGFTDTAWFAPRRDRSGCMTSILALEARGYRNRGRRDFRARLKTMGASELAVRASASSLGISVLVRCLEQAQDALPAGTASAPISEIRRILVSPKEKVVALAVLNGTDVVLRLPFSRPAAWACRQNMLALERLGALPHIADRVPRFLHEGEIDAQYFTVEHLVEGLPLRSLPSEKHELALVDALLKSINPPDFLRARQIDTALFQELIEKPLGIVLPRLPDPRDRALLTNVLTDGFLGKTMAFGIRHGDFSLRNIYLKGGRISGVIDWEEGSMNGLPVLDAISHLCSSQSRRGTDFAHTLSRLTKRDWPEPRELAFLERCYAYFGVEPDQHFALVVLHWLLTVEAQSEFWYANDPEFVQAHILDVANLLVSDHPGGKQARSGLQRRSTISFENGKPMSVAPTSGPLQR